MNEPSAKVIFQNNTTKEVYNIWFKEEFITKGAARKISSETCIIERTDNDRIPQHFVSTSLCKFHEGNLKFNIAVNSFDKNFEDLFSFKNSQNLASIYVHLRYIEVHIMNQIRLTFKNADFPILRNSLKYDFDMTIPIYVRLSKTKVNKFICSLKDDDLAQRIYNLIIMQEEHIAANFNTLQKQLTTIKNIRNNLENISDDVRLLWETK